MKVASIVGARPQFIKAAPVSRSLREVAEEVLVHTGQHYDPEMSAVFFEELQIPDPDCNLGVGSGTHAWQTGQMLIRIEEVLLAEQPDWVIVYGDTNSTLAGCLAAVKLQIPVAHIEAGLRSYNRAMPEEHNRVLTDHASQLLLCPTQTAVDNLAREGITRGVHLVGDVMYDSILHSAHLAEERSRILAELELSTQGYCLATVHRPRNTDDPERLRAILAALAEIAVREPVVLPIHPRTRRAMESLGAGGIVPLEGLGPRGAGSEGGGLRVIGPLGYLDMLALERQARLILTDSGGVQKEAYFFAVPCLTFREETEWPETVEADWNRLVGAKKQAIVEAASDFRPHGRPPQLFGTGHAAEEIVGLLTGMAAELGRGARASR
jgi:UDP-N-acetylglucosamine 2-epimerase